MGLKLKVVDDKVFVEVDLSALGFASGRCDFIELQENEEFKGVKYNFTPEQEIIIDISRSVLESLPTRHTTYQTKTPEIKKDDNIEFPVNKKLEAQLVEIFDETNSLATIELNRDVLKQAIIFKDNLLRKYPIDKGTFCLLVYDFGSYRRTVNLTASKELCISLSKDEISVLRNSKKLHLIISEYKKNKFGRVTYIGEKVEAENCEKTDPYNLKFNRYYNHNAVIQEERQNFLKMNRDQ